MCGRDNHGAAASEGVESSLSQNAPPTWDEIQVPADHILQHLTDAHCHPTDLNLDEEDYDNLKLGSIAAMATMVDDQEKVKDLGKRRAWKAGDGINRAGKAGAKVITCFGYHPWFTHRYSLLSTLPSKEDHYTSIFFTPTSLPNSKPRLLLRSLLPYLPDPIPFEPLLTKLRADIQESLNQGNMTMLGEIGLDAQARMRWPTHAEAKKLYGEYLGERGKKDDPDDLNGVGEWKRLTPFKTDMKHQRAIVEMQMEVAVELGVNVSFHCVASPGPTLDILTSFRDRHRTRFTNRINVDLHSAGGWTPEFWRNAEKQLLNLYASPSISVTSRVQHAAELIKSISKDRMLVESDSHDVRQMAKWVWGAVEWISNVKGWKIEGRDGKGEEWISWGKGDEDEEEEMFGKNGKVIENREVWAVRTLEKNWARFMHLTE